MEEKYYKIYEDKTGEVIGTFKGNEKDLSSICNAVNCFPFKGKIARYFPILSIEYNSLTRDLTNRALGKEAQIEKVKIEWDKYKLKKEEK
jgi:hypothetical protein